MSSEERRDSEESAKSKHKWKSAFRVVQGFNRFKTIISSSSRNGYDSESESSKSRKKKDSSASSSIQEDEIDPVYLAIKRASDMYKLSQVHGVTSAPTGAKRKTSVTALNPPAAGSSRDSLGADSGYDGVSTLSSSETTKMGSRLNSSPMLKTQNSTDSDGSGPTSHAHVGPRRAPQLNAKMKSMSLDSSDQTEFGRYGSPNRGRLGGGMHHGLSPRRGGAHLAVPSRALLHKNSSIETSTDETDPRSSTSCSPCPSSQAGSTTSLPSGSLYVVIHSYQAKFPEELDLRSGDRVVILDSTGADWFHGYRLSDKETGMFPTTCVTLANPRETVQKVLQTLNLADGHKILRLYRDQVVFGIAEPEDGIMKIRTERGFIAHCPIQYLASFDY